MEQQDWKSVNFEEIVQRVVNAETKMGPRSSFKVRDLDIYYSKNHCSFNSIALKVQTQGTTAKDFFYPEESRAKETKSVYIDAAKPSELAKKKDKQKNLKCQWKHIREPKKTPVTDDNAINASRRTRKRSMTLIRLRASNTIKKATIPITALS